METVEYVFGYGSLVDPDDHLYLGRSIKPVYGSLEGFERHWRLAFDNLDPRRDRKHYLEQGNRYRGHISMLGITPLRGACCNGLAIPVDRGLSTQIQEREGRLYSRSDDLRDRFTIPLDRPLVTYIPIPSGRDLYYRALDRETLALPSSYVETVERAFSSLGEGAFQEYLKTTQAPRAPLRQLDFFRQPGAL
jgi:hypothetical protein